MSVDDRPASVSELVPASVSELVTLGICSGTCLVSVSSATGCQCACRGEYHGALAEHQVNVPVIGDFAPDLLMCCRCQRGADEKCLDRWLADEPIADLSKAVCGCGCWTRWLPSVLTTTTRKEH